MKRALIIGIGGQDGSYLAEVLLEKGYEVHGLVRRSSVDNLWRIRHLMDMITHLHRGDLADPLSIDCALRAVNPDEVYNEADQDNVSWSRCTPGYNLDVTAGAVGRLLESLRLYMFHNPRIRFFQSVSATMFGASRPPQAENSPLDPQSPYACAKACAWHLCRHYRQEYGLYVATAIMFNHDSPRRMEQYLLQKICRGAVRIVAGQQKHRSLGNLDTRVDIGFARDYMEGVWTLMQLPQPDDFVLATGVSWSIRSIVLEVFRQLGLPEDGETLSRLVRPDPEFATDLPQPALIGDTGKAYRTFGFQPPTSLRDLIAMILAGLKGP